MNIIYVGIGGFIGSCSRFLITRFFLQVLPGFPLGTLVSNIIAGFLIGTIIGVERLLFPLPPNAKLFLTTGLLGGLSTFSAFSLETIVLFEQNNFVLAGLNIILNVGVSLLCVVLGILLVKNRFL